MKSLKILSVLALIALLAASCSTPNLGYFKEVESGQQYDLPETKSFIVQTGDVISILVSSRDPQLAYIFNLPVVSRIDAGVSQLNINNSRVATYRIDPNGEIDFPVLGKLHIAGMTRSEIAAYIKGQLVGKDLLRDAIVTVDLLNLYYSVMGEVKDPGRFAIDQDRVSLLDAISRAGDLTIYGRRDNVLVLREDGNKQLTYRIDLTKPEQIYSSPAFWLKANDKIYIEPNIKRARESTELGTTLIQPSFWMSTISFITSMCIIIFK